MSLCFKTIGMLSFFSPTSFFQYVMPSTGHKNKETPNTSQHTLLKFRQGFPTAETKKLGTVTYLSTQCKSPLSAKLVCCTGRLSNILWICNHATKYTHMAWTGMAKRNRTLPNPLFNRKEAIVEMANDAWGHAVLFLWLSRKHDHVFQTLIWYYKKNYPLECTCKHGKSGREASGQSE